MAKTRGETVERTHISAFKLQLELIKERLKSLNEFVLRARLTAAEIYELPTVTKDEEKARLLAQRKFLDGRVDEYVEPAFNVTTITGDDALEKTLRHYARYEAPFEDSTRYVKRLPGAIFIRSNEASEILEEVTAINELKKDLAVIAKGLAGHVDERWEIIHSAIPGFISAAAYRTIPIVAKDDTFSSLYSVRFAYDHRTRNEPFTRKALLDKLDSSLRYTDVSLGMQLTIQNEMKRISEFEPNTEFVQRRNMPAVPICKVRGETEKDGSSKLEKFVAHSPILFVNMNKPERYSELSDYAGRVLTPSSDTIIRRLHIFRK
jgi:DNA replication terminus site-binding protein